MDPVKFFCRFGYLFSAIYLYIYLFHVSAKAFWILSSILLFLLLNLFITHPLQWITQWLWPPGQGPSGIKDVIFWDLLGSRWTASSGQGQGTGEEAPLIKQEENLEVSNYQANKEEENMGVPNYQAIRQDEMMAAHSGDQSRTIQPTKSNSTRNHEYQSLYILHNVLYYIDHPGQSQTIQVEVETHMEPRLSLSSTWSDRPPIMGI